MLILSYRGFFGSVVASLETLGNDHVISGHTWSAVRVILSAQVRVVNTFEAPLRKRSITIALKNNSVRNLNKRIKM